MGGKGVGAPVRRLSPTVLAAIALGLLLAIILGAMLLRGRDGEDDRLTNAVTEARADPEKDCASQKTYDLIKRDLFRRAAALRGSDQAVFDKLAAYSSLRMEAPAVNDENAKIGSVTCSGTATLDLPPGAAVVGGRRSLGADLLYTVQPAADGSGKVVTVQNADAIITPLATLARVGAPAAPEAPDANVVVAEPPVGPGAPTVIEAPQAPEPPAAPEAPQPTASANPSFNCGSARTRGEIAVCGDEGLAALDRRMAAQFSSAMSGASPQQRALLQRTRNDFLRYRDSCPSNDCIAQTYRGRMREIRDIMLGRWTPPR